MILYCIYNSVHSKPNGIYLLLVIKEFGLAQADKVALQLAPHLSALLRHILTQQI